MNNTVFGETMENVRKHRDIKLVTTEKRRIKLVSEPNYHATKHFSENSIAVEMEKAKVKMNNPVYLGLPILDMSKTLMYEFWYDYLKPKYNGNVKLCYMDTDSYVYNVYTENVNKITLNSSDNKRLQTFDGITTYPYGANAFRVCENEMMIELKDFKICDSENDG